MHSVTPSRSEAIQSWLLGRPSIGDHDISVLLFTAHQTMAIYVLHYLYFSKNLAYIFPILHISYLTDDVAAKVMQSPVDCDYQHHSWVPDTKYKSKKQNKSKGE